jgi:hypothetical protein
MTKIKNDMDFDSLMNQGREWAEQMTSTSEEFQTTFNEYLQKTRLCERMKELTKQINNQAIINESRRSNKQK